MKKLLILMLCLTMCAVALVACNGGGDTTDAPGTDPETTTYDYEKIPDVIEPHEDKTVTAEELGYSAAAVADNEKYWVARAKTDKNGNLTVTSLNPGTTTFTVLSNYAEKIEVTVTVALDYSIESIDFEKFEKPENWVMATAPEFGMSPNNTDNAAALQAAFDFISSKGGGTVYVPKGTYTASTVVLKEGVTLRLEGVIEDYNKPFDSTLAAYITSGTKFAVIKANGKDMFINHPVNAWGRTGCDNIGVYGGVLDMNGKNRAFIWCCADGVNLENVIMKDCPNNHAIQVTGSKNVVIRDCLFAGYNPTSSPILTRETIQIESTTTGAIGGTTSLYDEFEYYHCENVVIEDCYFGKSDEYQYHLIPIGHHGHASDSPVTGLKITGCTFENPTVCGIKMYAYSDVEIANNKFTSNNNVILDGVGRYMIELFYGTGDVKINKGDYNKGSYLALGFNRQTCNNISIHDNEFTIGVSSKMCGALRTTIDKGEIAFDAKAVVNTVMVDFYKDKSYSFTGYKLTRNRVSDLSFCDNVITVENAKLENQMNNVVSLSRVRGLTYENNEVTSLQRDLVTAKLDGQELYGVLLVSTTSADNYARNFIVLATSANKKRPIVMMGGESDIEAFCTASNYNTNYNFNLAATEGGIIERWTDHDGNLFVNPIANEGYVFDGYYVNDVKIEDARFNFTGSTKVEVRFVAE